MCIYRTKYNIKNIKKKIDNTLVSFRHVHNNKCMQSRMRQEEFTNVLLLVINKIFKL